MYVYLYDPLLKERKYQSILKSIENRLTDFGITGRIVRLTPFTNVRPVLEDELSRGSKNVVVVGADETFGNIMARSAGLPVTFGYIPVGDYSALADVLGIPMNADACDVLSARKIEQLDIGWMNGRYFVSNVIVEPAVISVEYDGQFRVRSKDGEMGVTICNLLPFSTTEQGAYGTGGQAEVHPQDGQLDAFLQPMEKVGFLKKTIRPQAPSIFPFREMIIRSRKPFVVYTDGKQSKEIQITVRLAQEKLNMVVGKKRKF